MHCYQNMGTDSTRVVDKSQLEVVPVNVNDELISEVITVDEIEPGPTEEIPQLSTNVTGEEATSASSVIMSTPWEYHNQLDFLAREVKALKERLADLMKRIRERLIQEELPALASAANEPAALDIVNTPPVAPRNSQSSSSNAAVKRKSSKSKYAKKRRIVIPGGTTRISRSLNDKPLTTTVGEVNLATAAYDDDEDFD